MSLKETRKIFIKPDFEVVKIAPTIKKLIDFNIWMEMKFEIRRKLQHTHKNLQN